MNQNKLIAEFMGMKPHHQDSSCMTRVDDTGSNEVVPVESMSYHTSWDWLMPVVQKISNMKEVEVEFTIGDRFVWVTAEFGDSVFFSGNNPEDKKEPMISKVYRGVVSYIEKTSEQ